MRLAIAAIALMLATSTANAQYQDMVMNDQPSAYWPLTDPASATINTTEAIGNLWTYAQYGAQFSLGSPGKTGGTAWHYNGPMAWEWDFTQRWQVDHAPGIDLAGGPMSVEVWHKSDIHTNTFSQVLVEKLAAYGPGYWNHPWAGGGFRINTRYWHGGYSVSIHGNGTYDALTVNSASSVPANVWTHIAMTFDGSTLRLYLNGILEGQATTTQTGWPKTNGGPLRIGTSTVEEFWCMQGSSYCGKSILHGSLQHIALYKHALSQVQIAAHVDAANNGDVGELGATEAKAEPDAPVVAKPIHTTWGRMKAIYR